ncbi:hypothetical protein HanOQP8_Chr01g0036321 [Helianthus annuus]|nr:hypothetical protein HanOQP8_Chr01g0036321 [Helianthus annuus]
MESNGGAGVVPAPAAIVALFAPTVVSLLVCCAFILPLELVARVLIVCDLGFWAFCILSLFTSFIDCKLINGTVRSCKKFVS